ncbi:hypothetical protein GEMRC1_011847 [Eukaryota sp. GEM-RC1]
MSTSTGKLAAFLELILQKDFVSASEILSELLSEDPSNPLLLKYSNLLPHAINLDFGTSSSSCDSDESDSSEESHLEES